MIGELLDPRKEFGKAVTEVAKTDSRVVVLSADSGKSSGFGNFMAEFPDRYFECGIMEQGVVGMAAGLATAGKVPVFCAIAPFVTARPFEMVRNDLGYEAKCETGRAQLRTDLFRLGCDPSKFG